MRRARSGCWSLCACDDIPAVLQAEPFQHRPFGDLSVRLLLQAVPWRAARAAGQRWKPGREPAALSSGSQETAAGSTMAGQSRGLETRATAGIRFLGSAAVAIPWPDA